MGQEYIYQSGDLDVLTPFYKEIKHFIKDRFSGKCSLINFGCGIKLRLERTLYEDFPGIVIGGVDINMPDSIPEGFEFFQYDIQQKGIFREKQYDIVFFSELIEHIDDGDGLLDNCHLNCRDGGYLICTIPNLASLFGRFELLTGLQPHILEASNRHPLVGCGRPGRLNNPRGISIHHIRGFTYRAMVELIEKHGFRVLFTKGHFRQGILKPFSIFKSIAADIFIVAKKVDVERCCGEKAENGRLYKNVEKSEVS